MIHESVDSVCRFFICQKYVRKGAVAVLVALDANGNRVVALDTTDKQAEYFCPKCGERVILKRGSVKIPHFAHEIKSDCTYGEGESQEHLEVKQWLYEYFKQRGIEAYPEFRQWDDIRPDVAVKIGGRWVGFEIQKSMISIEDIQDRMERNRNHGVSVLWILPQSMYDKMKNGNDFRLWKWQQYLMDLYDGTLFVYGNGSVHAIKCENAERYHDEYWFEGEWHGGYYYELQSTFNVVNDMVVFLEMNFECENKPKNKEYPPCMLYRLNYKASQDLKEQGLLIEDGVNVLAGLGVIESIGRGN